MIPVKRLIATGDLLLSLEEPALNIGMPVVDMDGEAIVSLYTGGMTVIVEDSADAKQAQAWADEIREYLP